MPKSPQKALQLSTEVDVHAVSDILFIQKFCTKFYFCIQQPNHFIPNWFEWLSDGLPRSVIKIRNQKGVYCLYRRNIKGKKNTEKFCVRIYYNNWLIAKVTGYH